MEVLCLDNQKKYAVKRFEHVWSDEQRTTRLLREMSILAGMSHQCINSLKCIIPPKDYENYKEVYLVLKLCDMDLKKLLKSSKHLEEV